MGFQFAHIQNFSRKEDRSGRNVAFVLAEVRRVPSSSLHVSAPTLPDVIWGCSIEQVEREHDSRVAIARAARNGPKGITYKSIRTDQHTLCTVVMSHPYKVQEVKADPLKRSEIELWEKLNIKWLQERFGGALMSVVRHTDEKQWHLHAFALPRSEDMKASALHPGQAAKTKILAAASSHGEDKREAIRRSDRAYKAAMREWQDDYFRAVGAPCGLARLGPAKRRLTRCAWHHEQQQAKALKDTRRKAENLKRKCDQYVSKVRNEAAQVRRMAELNADAATNALKVASSLKMQAKQHHAEAERKRQEAHKLALETERAAATARRFSGIGGALRSFWDGLRKTSIAAKIRADFIVQIEEWQCALAVADARLRSAGRRQLESEKKAKASSRAAAEFEAQRDDLRRRLADYEPTANCDVAPVTPRPHH